MFFTFVDLASEASHSASQHHSNVQAKGKKILRANFSHFFMSN